jgi:hypothetical protein
MRSEPRPHLPGIYVLVPDGIATFLRGAERYGGVGGVS